MSLFTNKYDVIVVGGGHSGCEAATAAANMGVKTLLITMNIQNVAQMSCNPAMGGIAKGQIIREIDALGGFSGVVSDQSAIQFKMLNKSKGPAMWSPRVQSDRMKFSELWRLQLEQTPNLDLYQDMVVDLIVNDNKLEGVITSLGQKVYSKTVILTNGTFLNGIIHIGEKQFGGGRAGESASHGITEALQGLGFTSGRMKTGTPPRVDGRSLDYSKMLVQPGDSNPNKFSYLPTTTHLTKQRDCWLTYTSDEVHELLRSGFDRSPMFNGRIKSIGPRYCPSIEDKINRFADKDRHQLFVEPEGWHTCEMYVNGFSTSLPEEIQFQALKKVPGFENVKFFRPGYAIEYDYFPPTQLTHTLETKLVEGLFFSGQINGTTGYEEAASQGLLAGINAALKVLNKPPFILKRDQAYIGVLIDDLITKGTDEPYRMFTSRAEYRTLLRQDNADQRLTQLSYDIGLATKERLDVFLSKKKASSNMISFFKSTSVNLEEINSLLTKKGTSLLKQSDKLFKVISRPELNFEDIKSIPSISQYIKLNSLSNEMIDKSIIEVKYSGYIQKERNNADKLNRLEYVTIPMTFKYESIKSLSIEAIQKLNVIRPKTIAQASRISGVSPSDISILLIHLGR